MDLAKLFFPPYVLRNVFQKLKLNEGGSEVMENSTVSPNTNNKTVQQVTTEKWTLCPSRKAKAVIAVSLLVYLLLYLQIWDVDKYPKVIRKIISKARHVSLNESITPTIKEKVFLLILINSIPKTSDRRTVLRETWAGTAKADTAGKSLNLQNSFKDKLQVFCIFLVALSSVNRENIELAREAYTYGDILRIPTAETYRNMIKKIWQAYQWAMQIKPKYLMKVDDDVYVNIPHLITWLHQKSLPQNLYAGWVLHLGRIVRSPGNQWYVSYAQFHEHYYPDYCIGPFYILSGNLLENLIKISSKIKRFEVEDAYLGVLMRRLKVKPLRINNLFVWDPRLSSMIPKWEEPKFQKVICLGEKLESKMIRFIHNKYKKIGYTFIMKHDTQ